MRMIHFGLTLTGALMLTFTNAHAVDNPAADAELRAGLQRVAESRVLFGHQSVGSNILAGVRDLAAASGVAIRVQDVQSASQIGQGTFGHTFVADNGNPRLKLKSFEQAMAGGQDGPDIALVKFCYVDIGADTDVKSLFAQYRSTIESLRTKHPKTTFVHVTAPLTDIQRGAKAYIKGLVGKAPYGIRENGRREEYNALLRQTYGGREPLFDLARLESTNAQGQPVTVEWGGTRVPAMATEYTDDGGHLNAEGRRRAARELISVLASVAARPSDGSAPK